MYYHLRQTPVMEGLYMTVEPDLGPEVDWLSGCPHEEPIPIPLTIELDDEYGTTLPDIFDDAPLVMKKELVSALREAGVDNIDTYAAVLVDRKRKKTFEGYEAVQVVGRIAAADLGKSVYEDPAGAGHTLVQFQDLVLDGRAIRDALLFRLHESASTIVVAERVKKRLETLPLQYVSLLPVGAKPVPALETEDDEE